MNKKITFFSLIILAISFTSIALLSNVPSKKLIHADETSYSLTLSNSENKITKDSYLQRTDISFYSSTKENAFVHTIYNVKTSLGNWGQMLEGGYLVPKFNDFNQIQSIVVNFSNPGTLYLHPAASYKQLRGNNTDANPNINGFQIVSGTIYNFSSSTINAYEIYSVGDTDISSINISYKCSISDKKSEYGVLSIADNKVKLTGSSNRKCISYVGIDGGSVIGSSLNISFKGKNMPNVCLFTDSTCGQALKGGEGLLLLTSFIQNIDSDSSNTTRMMPYAPYRWSDTDDLTARRFSSSLISNAGYASSLDNENCSLIIKIGNFTDTSVCNLDISFIHGTTEVHKAIAIDTASFGKDEKLYENTNLILYGQGHDIEFSYDLNKKWCEENVVHNDDGTVTIRAGSISGSSGNYKSSHGYLGLIGDYDIGSKITTYFTGKNIPNISLFSDINYGSLISDNHKGIYIATDSGNNSSPFNERLTIYSPYRLCKSSSTNYQSDYRIYTANPTSQNPFGISCLNDSISYRYEIDIVSLSSDLRLYLIISLYNDSTNDLISSITFNEIYNKLDTNVSLQNCRKVIFYGQYKDITFSYNISKSNFSNEGATFNSDGSINLVGGSATNTKSSLSYIGDTNCGVGSKISTYFKGKNIPNVCLFASSSTGQAISPENTGLYLGTTLARIDGTYDTRMVAYAPYRWSKTGADRAGTYRIKTIPNSKFGFSNLDDSIFYRYDISLDAISKEEFTITVFLYNDSNDELIEKNIISGSYVGVTSSIDLSKNCNVVFYGQHTDITFSYSINNSFNKEQIHTYGYASPTDGSYYENGEKKTTGEDYRTIERYKEYKEAGMDTLLLQGNDPYRGTEVWNTSQTKKNLDNATAAGLKRAIVFDKRIYEMSQSETSLIGEGKYSSITELAETFKTYIKDYSTHEIFSGVMLIDEPSTKYFAAIHDIENAFALIDENIECYVNLLPYYATKAQLFTNGEDVSGLTRYEAYTKYCEDFVNGGHVSYLCMDSYPYRYNESKSQNYFNSYHFPGVQIIADVAKNHNIKHGYVLPSFSATKGKEGKPIFVEEDETMMRYMFNSALAFGSSYIGYFTYWRKQNNTTSEWFIDGTSFMTQTGLKTPLYTWVQKVYGETSKIRNDLVEYQYQSSSFYNSSIKGDAINEEIPGINISTSGSFLVTHFSNGINDLYAIMNIEDVFNQTSNGANIMISSSESQAFVYTKNSLDCVAFEKNLFFSLKCGELVFVRL